MKKIYFLLFLSAFILEGRSQSGVLDKSFGNNGIIKTALSGNGITTNTTASNALSLSNGRILVVLEVNAMVMVSRRFPSGGTDSSYGSNGFSVPVNMNQPSAALQSDGKVVVAGFTNYANADFILARFNTDGTLDASFGKAGVVIQDAGSNNDVPKAIVIRPNGKILTGGQSYRNGISQFALFQFNGNGTPDAGFGTNGLVIGNFGNSSNINALILQNDNKVVAAGNYFDGTLNNIALARYKVNGQADSTFNGTGRATANSGYADNAVSAALQSDGKIVVGGYYTDASYFSHPELVRFSSQGKLDKSFNQNGFLLTSFGFQQEYLSGLLIQKSGRIIAGGYVDDNPDAQNIIMKAFNSSGGVDSSFGINGISATSFSSYVVSNLLSFSANGNILAGGRCTPNGYQQFTLTEYNANGMIQTSFADAGKLISYYPGKDITYPNVMVQGDGKLVASAQTFDGTTSSNFLFRFSSNGISDPTYGVHGSAPTNGYYSVMQTDSKVVEATYQNGPAGGAFWISRYKTNGSPDLAYGSNGSTIVDFFGGSEYPGAMGIQKDNKVVVAGGLNNSAGSDLLVARFNTDGSPDATFGTGGAVTTDILSYDFPQSMAIASDGKIMVAGYGFTPSFQIQLILARFNSNGSLDSNFANKGSLVLINGVQEFTGSVVVQSNGKILLGSEVSFDYNSYHNYITRYNVNGTPDNSFGVNGTIEASGTNMLLAKDQKILVSGYVINEQNNRTVTLARYDTVGKLDPGFGNAGITTTNFTGGDDVLTAMAYSGAALYVGGYSSDPNSIGLLGKYRVLTPTVCATLSDFTLPTDRFSCSATINENASSIAGGDVLMNHAFRYSLAGSTKGSGLGSVSRLAFNKGATEVNYILEEDSTENGTFTVTVEDQEAPVIGSVAAQILSQASSDQFTDVLLNYSPSDNCTLGSNQISVSDEEAVSAESNSKDWILINDHHLRLSAVPLNGGLERKYTIRITSSDASGNKTDKYLSVRVPAMTAGDFVVRAVPNPSNSSFNITTGYTAGAEPMSFKLMNAQGVVLETITHVLPGQTIHVGNGLKPGVYYLQAIKTNSVKSIKLVKM